MAGVAQLVEHQIVALGAAGSSPVTRPLRRQYNSLAKKRNETRCSEANAQNISFLFCILRLLSPLSSRFFTTFCSVYDKRHSTTS